MIAGLTARQYTSIALLLAVAAALLLTIHFYAPSASDRWWQSFYNTLHVPVFGIVSLCIFLAAGKFSRLGVGIRITIALVVSVLLSLLSEGAQISGPRDASLDDLVSDWLGAGGTMLLTYAYAGRKSMNTAAVTLSFIGGVGLLLVALFSFLTISAAYIERNLREPLLVSFDSSFSDHFWQEKHTTLELITRPGETRRIGEVTLNGGDWPGLVFSDLLPDWRGYSALIVELRLDEGAPFEINVRVHDLWHNLGEQPHNDRFNTSYRLEVGSHELRIPVEEIRNAPDYRKMDLARIDGIVVFSSRDNIGRTFQLVEIRLEK